jgi:hypothetical protein
MIKVRGRPVNPYTTSDSLWRPGYTKSGFFEFDNLIYNPPSLHYLSKYEDEENLPSVGQGILENEIEWYIYALLAQAKVPLVRRFIEQVFVFDHGMKPHAVTYGLSVLREGTTYGLPKVYWQGVDMGHRKATDVYSIKPLSPAEIRYLRKLYDLRKKYLNQKVLGNAGEQYVRSALKRDKRYCHTTREKNLGKIKTPSKCLDILTTDAETGIRYGIEVRNSRAFLHPESPWIDEVKDKAKSLGRTPWLICAYAVPGMVEICEARGVRLTVLGFQVAPEKYPHGRRGRRIKKVLEELLPIHGPSKWELYGERYQGPSEWPPRQRREAPVSEALP